MSAGGPKTKMENIRVSIETRCHTIVGMVHPPSLAYRSRLSDLLNQPEISFLPVTGAVVYGKESDGQPLYSTEFILVNLNKIDLICPLEDS